MYSREQIRNLAIIAHIDHGKTTLVDSLLKQSNIFRDNEVVAERMMDSYDQERERGITIFAKPTSVYYKDYKLNLIDTPGHADFSGEVERVLGLVNCVILLIDAVEGPMPQTRFVLSQALRLGLRPIVLVNKIDRLHANPDKVLNETFDLFVELGATDEQLDFPVVYASGLAGFAIKHLTDPRVNMEPLFDAIVEFVPAPPGSIDKPFLLQSVTLTYDDFLGRKASGRILEGTLHKGDTIVRIDNDGKETRHRVTKIEGYHGLRTVEVEEAGVGDIVAIAGIPDITIGDTLCDPTKIIRLPPIHLSAPTLSIELGVNSSPFAGKEGKHVTMNKLRERLEKEKRSNISLRIEAVEDRDDQIRICGRGELHLAVLLEQMRREEFEFSIAKPQVITQTNNGQLEEPIEIAHIEVPEEFSGSVIEKLSRRKGEMLSLETNEHKITSMQFSIPTRGLIGLRNEFLTMTKGLGILSSRFDTYGKWRGEIPSRLEGALISLCAGKATGYSLYNIQERGTLFITAGDEVYEGMIVGEHSRENDLIVNVVKGKQLTNVRASGNDENISLTPPRRLSLETAIDVMQDDELVEITPISIRLRKRYLTENDRKRARTKK